MEGYAPGIVEWIGRRAGARAVVVGVHGPQGSGKSTLCAWLANELAARLGLRAVSVSVDDFYLTHAEQRALAAAHPGNRYLEHRGYPGTHDVELGARTLDALLAPRAGEVAVPAYDKSAHAGRGDRAPPEAWPRVAMPLDVVLFEGWMLAFEPVASERVPEPALVEPNARLAGYRAWRERLDSLIWLDLAGDALDPIRAWRVGAERARRESGAAALSDAEAHDYIERFLPAYRLWTPGLREDPPRPCLHIRIDAERRHLSADDL